MKKFYLAFFSVLFFASHSWAEFEASQASWKGDLKIKDKLYSCEGEKEISQFGLFSFNEEFKKNIGSKKTLALCLNDKNQALWLISAYTEVKVDYSRAEIELVETGKTDYYENCRFIADEQEEKSGWDCEKTEVLSEDENLLSKIKLENKKEIDPTDPYAIDEVNRRTWFKQAEEENAESNDECGCDDGEEEIFSRYFCENFTVEEFRETMKKHGKENIDGDLDGLGLTQLMCAAFNKDLTMAEELIKAGANVNAENCSGKTVLILAAKVNPNPEMIKLLLKNGANINAVSGKNDKCSQYSEYDYSALIWAIRYNDNQEVAKTLLEAKPYLENWGLESAIFNKYPLDFIKDYLKNFDVRKTPDVLDAAVMEKDFYGLTLIKLLLDAGINIKDESIEAIPRIAGKDNNLEIMEFLIKTGADVNKALYNGTTALMEAKTVEETKLLIEAGANPNAVGGYQEETALMNAKNPEIVKLLIEAGADVNFSNKEGKTALMKATNPKIVKLLLDAGADPKVKDNEGKTALDWARHKGNSELIELLEKALKPKTNEPKEISEIKQIYKDTKALIPNRDKLSTNYEGKILVKGVPINFKTSHKAYFAKNTKRIIFIESSFKSGNNLNSLTEYLFDKGNLIFVQKMPKAEENNPILCYYKGEKVIYRQGEFATTEECSRLRKKGEELKKSILIMQN